MMHSAGHAMDKGEWSIDLNGLSWHDENHYTDNGVTKSYNETNPGVGASIAYRDDLDIKFGFFENSYREQSAYAGVYYHKDFYTDGGWTVAPGVSLLLVSGYDDTPEDAPVIAPIPILGVSFGHKSARFNLGYVPFGEVDFATLQLQIVPKYW
ncbi:MAG: hypothetical protein PVG66_03515 [Chromatiales bacterium]